MRKNFKYYFFYFTVFLIGASVSAGLFFAYRFSLFHELSESVGGSLSLHGYILFAADFLRPLLLVFLAAFTVYSCAVGIAASLYFGSLFGVLVIRYGTSGLNPFTHAAALIFLLAFAFCTTWLCTETAFCRAALRTAAPSPGELLRLRETSSLLTRFLTVCLITLAVCVALYFFLLYFPLPPLAV